MPIHIDLHDRNTQTAGQAAPPSALLQQIARHAQQQPQQVALTGPSQSISYAQLQHRIDDLSQRLSASGFRQLGLLMDNSPDWIICQLAALKAAVCVIPLPLFFSPQQLQHTLDSCGIELLLCDQTDRLDPLHLTLRSRREIHPGALQRDSQKTGLSRPTGSCLITFTSGTTGQPKGVCLDSISLDRLCQSLYQQIEPLGIARHCCLLPLPVLLEHVAGALLSLYAGIECTIYPATTTGLSGSGKLDLPRFTAWLDQQQPDSLILVPELLQALVGIAEVSAKSSEAIPCKGLKPLRFVAVGGGHIAPRLLQRAQQLSLPVFEGYGLSECGSVVTLNTPQHRRNGSVGRPLPHCQIKLGEDNEVLIKGAAMLGYLGEPQSTAEAHSRQPNSDDVWLASGDIGRVDNDGYLYLEGRKSNVLINSFGRNLCPEWIEAELNSHPLIAQSCLIGDQRPFNIVLLTLSPSLTKPEVNTESLQRLIDPLNSRLPDYARINDYVLTRQPFSPANGQLTGNGRLKREPILDAYQSEIERCYSPAGSTGNTALKHTSSRTFTSTLESL
ncbi:MAG: AMP-binding protein [Motiliproteus sp.]